MPRVSWIESTTTAVAQIAKQVIAVAPPPRRKPLPDRTRLWPDDDLDEIEHPKRGGWIQRRRDWLRR
jgi:hypothetical protein